MSDKQIGEILTVSRTELCVDWKIPNFLSLSHKTGDYFESPVFHFLDVTWYLVIYPSGENKDCSRFVTAYLRKEYYCIKKYGIQYRIGIKKKDGSEYVTSSEFEDYQSESEDDESQSEDSESQPEDDESQSEDDESQSEDDESQSEDDEYESENNQTSRRVKLVKRSLLRAESTEFLPKGALALFCTLRASKIRNKEADTSTEILGGGDKYTEGKEKDLENNDGETEVATLPKPTGVDKLVRDFKNLLTSEKDTDVTLKVKNKEFRTHKNILRARSSVFDSMFDHDMIEKNSGVVDIPDCDPEAFQHFLTYLYSASMDNLSNDIIFNLYFIADKYDVEELKHKCVEFMASNLSVETFCNVITLALQREESALLQTATDFFKKNTKEALVSVQWQFFLKENPVTANELYIKSFDHNVIQK